VELTIHLYYDPESHNWGVRVPALRIVGGGQDTREEAGRAALDAIAFTLEADGQDGASVDGEMIEHYRVILNRAS
jgi:predicted RNase H-like HicB family nuclease